MVAKLIEWVMHLCYKVQLVERHIWKEGNTTIAIVKTITDGSYGDWIGTSVEEGNTMIAIVNTITDGSYSDYIRIFEKEDNTMMAIVNTITDESYSDWIGSASLLQGSVNEEVYSGKKAIQQSLYWIYMYWTNWGKKPGKIASARWYNHIWSLTRYRVNLLP